MISQASNFPRLLCGLVLSIALLNSCDVYTTKEVNSYVVVYNNLRSIELEKIQSAPSCISIHCGNDLPVKEYCFLCSGEDKDEYERLCLKHNDLKYKQHVSTFHHFVDGGHTFNDKDFIKIEITSDVDYDAAHPAGTSLADIVRFMSWSPIKFIDSGYSTFSHFLSSSVSGSFNKIMPSLYNSSLFLNESESTCYPIDKMVKDLQPEDLVLLGADSPDLIGILSFEKSPAKNGEHHITVKMKAETGEVFESTLQISL